MTSENRLVNAAAELDAADDALKVAQAAVDLDIARDAMSRAYYAAFHAARALLLLEGLEPRTHAGVIRLFGEHLIRTNELESRLGLMLTRLQAYRQASDYAYTFPATVNDAKTEIAAARELVEVARRAVTRRGG